MDPSLFFWVLKLVKFCDLHFRHTLKRLTTLFYFKCRSLYREDNFIFYPQIMTVDDYSCPLTSYLLAFSYNSELDHLAAEAHQGCLNWKGTFPVWEAKNQTSEVLNAPQ